jgi:Ras-related protein Rab-14
MLIGNKQDMEEQREVSFDEAARFAKENGLVFVEASAKTGVNVEHAFLKTATMIFENVEDGTVDFSSDGGVTRRTAPSATAPLDVDDSNDSASSSDCPC